MNNKSKNSQNIKQIFNSTFFSDFSTICCIGRASGLLGKSNIDNYNYINNRFQLAKYIRPTGEDGKFHFDDENCSATGFERFIGSVQEDYKKPILIIIYKIKPSENEVADLNRKKFELLKKTYEDDDNTFVYYQDLLN